MDHQDWNQVVFTKSDKPKYRGNPSRTLEERIEETPIKKTPLTVSKAIQKARLAKKLSQKDLAARLNVKVTTIVEYENGKARPNNTFISKLERILQTKLPRAK
uniref:Helix-turn-helix protein n=1 Tax=Megaviridae environmental sample TaxID=1737588 RepID=A0A5J6VKD8_9VIRU|nr:MAG: helix-turn-helix protein [Megaviridae environmental sample]